MTIVQKAKEVKDNPAALKNFCFTLFNRGKDWLDLETLMTHVGFKDDGHIYRLYEEWQDS